MVDLIVQSALAPAPADVRGLGTGVGALDLKVEVLGYWGYWGTEVLRYGGY